MKKGPLLCNISYPIWACIANRFISIVWQTRRDWERERNELWIKCHFQLVIYYHNHHFSCARLEEFSVGPSGALASVRGRPAWCCLIIMWRFGWVGIQVYVVVVVVDFFGRRSFKIKYVFSGLVFYQCYYTMYSWGVWKWSMLLEVCVGRDVCQCDGGQICRDIKMWGDEHDYVHRYVSEWVSQWNGKLCDWVIWVLVGVSGY